jgi:hypothetical protein
MTLRDTMARHGRTVLTRSDHFGETIKVRPKGAPSNGSQDRTVRAVVNRLDTEPAMPEARQVAKLRALVELANHATIGVTSVKPGDRLVLAMQMGAAEVVARITRVVSQDEGMFKVEVEA